MFKFLFRKETIHTVDAALLKVSPPILDKKQCKVTNIVDADTIDVVVKISHIDLKYCKTLKKFSYFQLLRIRVADFDAAEMSTYEGKIAKFIMSLYIESIPKDNLFVDSQKIDKFGRTLGSLYIMNGENKIELYKMFLRDLPYPMRDGKINRNIIGALYDGGKKTLDDSNFTKEKKTLDLDDKTKEKLREMYPLKLLYKALLNEQAYVPY